MFSAQRRPHAGLDMIRSECRLIESEMENDPIPPGWPVEIADQFRVIRPDKEGGGK